jgi:hypothetical protein
MKKYLVSAFVGLLISGCAPSVVTKTFTVRADPQDAVIKVVPDAGLTEQKYRSPATITVEVAAKGMLEVKRDDYKPMSIGLRQLSDGDTITIKLEKIQHTIYRLKYRLVAPSSSEELQYRDKTIAVSFAVGEQSFQMRLENLSSSEIKILWERAEYTDVTNRPYRLMHSGIRYADRNSPIPDQIVLSRRSVQESVIPIGNVSYLQNKKDYDVRPLFLLESEAAAGLKGKTFNLFIPIELNRQIIPYNFKIQIADSVKETN